MHVLTPAPDGLVIMLPVRSRSRVSESNRILVRTAWWSQRRDRDTVLDRAFGSSLEGWRGTVPLYPAKFRPRPSRRPVLVFQTSALPLGDISSFGGVGRNRTYCIRCNYIRGSMPFAAWTLLVPAIRQAVEQGLFGTWRTKPLRN
jgi:hypothetical protein